jgi:hypothetical protein
MSATGRWRPVVDQPPGGSFDLPLRNIIAQRFFEGDMPSYGNEWDKPNDGAVRIDATDEVLAWFRGLVDAGVEEAGELTDALTEHGSIEVWFVN